MIPSPPSEWTVRRAAALVAAPWRNGLGTSREIATQLSETGELGWQVGIADLVQDAVFSHYPDCDRVFTPIAGDPPPELAFHGGAFEPCPLLVPRRFPGDIPTLSRIPAPGRAFNAIVDRRRFSVDVTVQTVIAGQAVSLPEGEVLLVHCHRGKLAWGEAPEDGLGAGDTAMGAGPPLRATEECIVLTVAIRHV